MPICLQGGKEQELGFGDHVMMVELKTRVNDGSKRFDA
jgi:hypothetical protein